VIRVERLNGDVVYVNPDLVRTVMARPDTVLTFVDGSTMAILGPAEQFLQKWNEHRKTYPSSITKEASWK
jgi:uncharacterized protein YlzI (FlbEa/FlbD family)